MSLYIAIESSCDETSIALLESGNGTSISQFEDPVGYLNSFTVLGSIVSSQIKVHAQYGGVVPEVGARQHADQIHWIFQQLLQQVYGNQKDTNKILYDVKEIFVTTEPGLVSALRVGVEFAKTLQHYTKSIAGKEIPVIAINHLKGHVASSMFGSESAETRISYNSNFFPHLHLLVSGGNSQIILLNSWEDWNIVGKTLDDAAGECLDKIGRMLGLPYPGGVYCSRIAGLESENASNLPISMKNTESFDFSFSGLKTSVRYKVQGSDLLEFEKKLSEEEVQTLIAGTEKTQKLRSIKDMCVSAQYVVVSQLVSQFQKAIKAYSPLSIGLSGGVSANKLLRQELAKLSQKYQTPLYIPDMSLTGDNAVMIGLAGLLK